MSTPQGATAEKVEPKHAPDAFDENQYRATINQLAAIRGLTTELSVTLMSLVAAKTEEDRADRRTEFAKLVALLDQKLLVLFGDITIENMNRDQVIWIRKFVAKSPTCEPVLRAFLEMAQGINLRVQSHDKINYDEAHAFYANNWPTIRDETTNLIWDAWIDHDVQKDEAVKGMQKLSETLASTLDDIKRISMTVRMISLNAAVLASRAGDKGAGFSVIATEVRSLAEKIQSSANRAYNVLKDVDFDN